MATFPFMQVDAFTDAPLGGNPCAIVFEADSLTSAQMQAIAREQNLSETAFVLKSTRADVRARYFTPTEEIPLAGHPTIATVFALAESKRLLLSGDHTTIDLELEAGIIKVDVIAVVGRPNKVVMTQLKPRFLSHLDPVRTARAFGLRVEDLIPDVPVQVVSTGTPQLMVPVRTRDLLRRIRVDAAILGEVKSETGFFSAHLFARVEDGTFARHFAGPPGIFEDPFTGSATGGMGAYLWHYGLIDRPEFAARQGDWMERPGIAEVTILGPPEDIAAVKVAGGAVTVIRGTLEI